MKKLIIYYSLEGNTRLAAEAIAEATGADLAELKLQKPLPRGFMKFVIGGFQVIFKKNPAILPIGKNIDEYDMLFIGTPVWAGSFVPAMRTFLNTFKISSKKIALFCCYAGDKGKTFENLRAELSCNTVIGELEFKDSAKNGRNSVVSKVREWVKSIEVK